ATGPVRNNSMRKLHMQKHIAAVCLTIAMAGMGGCARTPGAKRDRFLASGKKLFEKKEYSRAILEFKNAVAVMPRDAEAYYQLGRSYAAYHELQTAVFNFRRAVDLNPK